MALVRKTLALVVWVVIYIPTTVFVVGVMVKNYVAARRKREESRP